MNWDDAIRTHGEALRRWAATIFAMLGIAPGEIRRSVPKPLYFAVLAVLRPAESALRRLIVVATRGMAPPPAPGIAAGSHARTGRGGEGRPRPPLFRLHDARKRFEPHERTRPLSPPRVTIIGLDEREPTAVPARRDPEAPRDAARLCRRLWALHRALSDLSGEAGRMLRWQARRLAERIRGKRIGFVHPMRPGWPPGYTRRGSGELHERLVDLQRLARWVEEGRVAG